MKLVLFLIPIIVAFLPANGLCQDRLPPVVRILEDEGDASKRGDGETLVFFADGRVGRIPNHRRNLLHRIRLAPSPEASLPDPASGKDAPEERDAPPFRPSVVSSAEADALFYAFNPHTRRRSQCYNRAEIWTYESYRDRSLNSMKVFLFFTLKYIREYRYRWWFHVAPMTLVSDGPGVRETVLDPGFLDHPVGLREWSDLFIRPKTECPVAEKYSDYEAMQNQVYCVFMKAPMFYWQPKDLEALEQGARPRKTFLPDEISHAYWQAFY